jgi:putative hydrolase of the HAD superfamily
MAGLKNKKHLFFDLDDTLWDFEKNSSGVLEALFFEFELDVKLKTDFKNFYATYKTINQGLWSQYYKKQIDKTFLRNNRFNETFKEFGYDNYAENLRVTEQYLHRSPQGRHLKEGCRDILDYLKENYTLHIITNGFMEVQHIKIDGCRLRDYFSQIVISEEHGFTKPDVEIFRLAEAFACAPAEDCVMIGDNYESDIEGALNAGWEAVYFSEENRTGHKGYFIKRLEELKKIF